MMRTTTRLDAGRLVAALFSAFYSPRPPRATVALYIEALQELHDLDAAEATVGDAIKSADRLPTIAELRRGYREHARRNAEARARDRGLNEARNPELAAKARGYLERLKGGRAA